jgi:lysophospholipase L1-like esterase
MRRLGILLILAHSVAALTAIAQPNQICDPYDELVATTPAPPTAGYRWKTYDAEYKSIPSGPVDLAIVGDSLAELWKVDMWRPLHAVNVGVGGDGTQHTLWRLNQPSWSKMQPRTVLLTIGSNNMAGGLKACSIMKGIAFVLERIRLIWPEAKIGVLAIPPRGPDNIHNDVRTEVNYSLTKLPGITVFNIENELLCNGTTPCNNYMPDKVHFTDSGYRILMHQMRHALSLGQ